MVREEEMEYWSTASSKWYTTKLPNRKTEADNMSGESSELMLLFGAKCNLTCFFHDKDEEELDKERGFVKV